MVILFVMECMFIFNELRRRTVSMATKCITKISRFYNVTYSCEILILLRSPCRRNVFYASSNIPIGIFQKVVMIFTHQQIQPMIFVEFSYILKSLRQRNVFYTLKNKTNKILHILRHYLLY